MISAYKRIFDMSNIHIYHLKTR